jgi:hypothetical protein
LADDEEEEVATGFNSLQGVLDETLTRLQTNESIRTKIYYCCCCCSMLKVCWLLLTMRKECGCLPRTSTTTTMFVARKLTGKRYHPKPLLTSWNEQTPAIEPAVAVGSVVVVVAAAAAVWLHSENEWKNKTSFTNGSCLSFT